MIEALVKAIIDLKFISIILIVKSQNFGLRTSSFELKFLDFKFLFAIAQL